VANARRRYSSRARYLLREFGGPSVSLCAVDALQPGRPLFTVYRMGCEDAALGGNGDQSRLYLVKLDLATGARTMDNAFHDADGKPGFNFAHQKWAHAREGSVEPHGVVFSRQKNLRFHGLWTAARNREVDSARLVIHSEVGPPPRGLASRPEKQL